MRARSRSSKSFGRGDNEMSFQAAISGDPFLICSHESKTRVFFSFLPSRLGM